MDVLHERCAALDIGKKDLKACVRTPNPSGRRSRRQEIRTYLTVTNSLLELRDWLLEQQVTLVVMEATGDYWRPAFYVLEDCLNVILVNAADAKGLPGRKTDVADAAWLCQLGDTFERELPGLAEADDAQTFGVVERVVLALNAVNEAHNGSAYETDEREQLCDFIDQSLTEHGVDIAALTARHGLGRYQITDKWRKW